MLWKLETEIKEIPFFAFFVNRYWYFEHGQLVEDSCDGEISMFNIFCIKLAFSSFEPFLFWAKQILYCVWRINFIYLCILEANITFCV